MTQTLLPPVTMLTHPAPLVSQPCEGGCRYVDLQPQDEASGVMCDHFLSYSKAYQNELLESTTTYSSSQITSLIPVPIVPSAAVSQVHGNHYSTGIPANVVRWLSAHN